MQHIQSSRTLVSHLSSNLQQTTKPSSINASLALSFARMLSAFFAIGGFCLQVHANIIFRFVQPNCDYQLPKPHQGCLRGQTCLQDNSCEQNWGPRNHIVGRQLKPGVIFRPDRRCGPDFEDASCKYSTCCTIKGYCSNDTRHCLPPGPGNDLNEPILGHGIGHGIDHGSPTTSDGTCGATNDGAVCGIWRGGRCCSMYGFCGYTDAHCGEGCQSGPCKQPPALPASSPRPAPMNEVPGSFEVVGQSGVPAMHAALMPNGRVVFLHKIENYTQVNLTTGGYAYSSEYDPVTNEVVPLAYQSNASCSGGTFLANDTLLSVGGKGPIAWLDPTIRNGFKGLRYLTRSSGNPNLDGEDWVEPGNRLDTARWYPSVQTLANGSIFVASGSLNGGDPTRPINNNPSFEILDPEGVSHGVSITMPLLVKAQPYYMYPFLHLLPTGDLFVFTSRSSQLFSVANMNVTKSLPDLPGDYRTYPNTGGSVLLPLSSANNWSPSVIICGGGAYQDIDSLTDPSCGRLDPLAEDSAWEIDAMPEGRGMVEGTLLPDGTILWLNGANKGAQGFGLVANPTMEALIYDPAAAFGNRWTRDVSSQIPRLYHSVALLLLDGTVMIAGSNPSEMPLLEAFREAPYATEFRVEIYTPPYLSGERANSRPTDVLLSKLDLSAQSDVVISFNCAQNATSLKVALYHGSFVTHSLHMGHRMLYLDVVDFSAGNSGQIVTASMPGNMNLTPPGPYVVYVVVDGVPSVGQFVNVFNLTENDTIQMPLSDQVLLPQQDKGPEPVPLHLNTTTCLPNSTSASLETTHPTPDTPLLTRQYSNTSTSSAAASIRALMTILPATREEIAHDRVLKPVPQTAHQESNVGGGGLLDGPSPAMAAQLKLPPMDPMVQMNSTSPSPQSPEIATSPAPPNNGSLTTSTIVPTTLVKRTRHWAGLRDE